MRIFVLLFITALIQLSCEQKKDPIAVAETTEVKERFTYAPGQEYKDYWFNGTAEISSYTLSQARYGELREGQSVLVFVTEPFSVKSNTKADRPTADDPSVLKLNFTKKFNTGIYPYSMMNSSFFPFEDGQHSLKIATSVQEWCGQTYMELKNSDAFEIAINSYFEGESRTTFKTEKVLLEDDLWSMIRLQPDNLPEGSFKALPGFFYLRLKHINTKPQLAEGTMVKTDSTSSYTIQYPELDRSLQIDFETAFPHRILGWSESYLKSYNSAETITTEGKLIKSIRSDYWRRNSNKDQVLRDSLGLK